MELYQLKTFVKVADEGNLTRAAELLFTSQPAISAQIKALEEEFGVTLFERTAKGMKLSPKGELLYAQAVSTLSAADGLKQQAQALQGELVGDVRIGVHTDFEFIRIGPLHARMGRDHPRISPHFIASMTANILPDIRKGKLDGGFFFGPCTSADLAVHHLADIRMCVAGPVAWGDRLEAADLTALAEFPWVYTSSTCPFYKVAKQLFGDASLDLENVVAYVDSEDAVRQLIRAGAGLSLLREDDARRLAQEGLVYCWDGEAPSVELNFAVQKNRSGESLIMAVVDQVTSMWDESGGQSVADADEAATRA